jgi:hypothetical protein
MNKIKKLTKIIKKIGFKEFVKKFLYQISFDKSSRLFYKKRKIYKEIQLFIKNRSENSLDFIIFSITPFDYRIQRPQHFAFEMAKKGHRIFYIENEFLINKKIDKDGFAPYLIKKRAENIYLIKLSSSKEYFIYNQSPSKKDINLMFASIKKLIYDAFIINPIAKIDHPFWAYLKEKLAMPIIYDCMDEHSGFKENSTKILVKEKELIKDSDLVLASSNYLYNKLKNQTRNLVKIPNAGDFYFFNKFLTIKTKKPDDLKNLKGKIIGYYGAIDIWLDTDLIEKTIKFYPQYNFVFIGRINNINLYNLSKKFYQKTNFTQ